MVFPSLALRGLRSPLERPSARAGRALAGAVLVALTLLAGAAGCSSPSFEGQVYRGHGLAFRIGPVPASWAPLETTNGLLAFRDEPSNATALINGRCGKDGDDVPLAALTQHLFLEFTERQVEEETVIPFDGREAARTVLLAKLDGVPKRFEAVVLKKDGCVYDLVLIAAPQTFAAARRGFDGVVAGFHTEPR